MPVQWGLIADMPAKIGGSFQEGRRNALATQAAQQEQQMNALRIQQAEQEMGNQNALREAYRSSGGDMGKLQEALKAQGMYEPAMKIQKGLSDQQKADMEAKKAELEGHAKRIEYTAQVLSSSHDQASHDANLAQLAQEIGQEHIQNVPKVFNPQELQFIIKKGMTVKDQAYQQMRAIDQAQRQQQLAQTATYQQAQLGLAGQAGQRAEKGLGFEERRVAASEQPKLESIPATHRMVYAENENALNKIDQAIEKIKANPKALGMGNIVGEAVTQRTDPEGVETRAALAEISSQKRHDLSGASITAAESPNLAPFIPKSTDTADTAIKKLEALKKQYFGINQEIEGMYSSGEYKNPLKSTKKEQTAPSPQGFKFLGFE